MPTDEVWQALLAAELPQPRLRALLEAPEAVLASAEKLLASNRLNDGEKERARKVPPTALRQALASGARILTESEYPSQMMEWLQRPPAVFVWGDESSLHLPSVGIVGTRAPTTYGKAAAYKFAEALARAGVAVISGGALGIDAAAHRGALEAGGRTVAVLGSGIDRVYPAVHRGLFQSIRERGCLVSQFAAGVTPSPYKFIVRNHLIAGLSRAVVVVEAPETSGSLTTAQAANDYGRQVFVVPANIDNANFRGSHALIRDGATLVDHPDQVLEALGLEPKTPPKPAPAFNKLQQRIVDVLGSEPLAAEMIVDRTGVSSGEVLAELTMLELEGVIFRDAGGYALRS